jgi:hypothetical protein
MHSSPGREFLKDHKKRRIFTDGTTEATSTRKVARIYLIPVKWGIHNITSPAHDMQSTSPACLSASSLKTKTSIVLLLRLRSSLAKDSHQGYLNASETNLVLENPPHQ